MLVKRMRYLRQAINSRCTKGEVWNCQQNCLSCLPRCQMLLLKNKNKKLLSKTGVRASCLHSTDEKRNHRKEVSSLLSTSDLLLLLILLTTGRNRNSSSYAILRVVRLNNDELCLVLKIFSFPEIFLFPNSRKCYFL